MPKFVGLVRGVNVGGANLVKMADLRAMLLALGAEEPQTVLQSGNFVFSGSGKADEWRKRIQAEAAKRLKLQAEFFVLTAAEWRAVASQNPFRNEAAQDPGRLLVFVFGKLPSPAELGALGYDGVERWALGERALYVHFPDGMGKSRLAAHTGWKRLTASATGRNWNTVLKLLAMTEG